MSGLHLFIWKSRPEQVKGVVTFCGSSVEAAIPTASIVDLRNPKISKLHLKQGTDTILLVIYHAHSQSSTTHMLPICV